MTNNNATARIVIFKKITNLSMLTRSVSFYERNATFKLFIIKLKNAHSTASCIIVLKKQIVRYSDTVFILGK